MTEHNTNIDKNIKFVEPERMLSPQRPMNTWKHMIVHVCILFLVIVLVMVYFSSTGSPQAGLLEVGISAFIFVALFHLVMKFFPFVSKIITSVIAIGFGIALIFVNYHYLKVVKTDATLRQLLVGDLLVHKIVKTIQKEPISVLTKKEIPQAVPETKPEQLSPAVSLDQLATTIAEPMTSDMHSEALQLTPLEHVIKSKTLFFNEKHASGLDGDNTPGKILPFIVKTHEPVIQEVAEKNDMSCAILLGVMQDAPSAKLKEPRIQSPLSEKTASIPIE